MATCKPKDEEHEEEEEQEEEEEEVVGVGLTSLTMHWTPASALNVTPSSDTTDSEWPWTVVKGFPESPPAYCLPDKGNQRYRKMRSGSRGGRGGAQPDAAAGEALSNQTLPFRLLGELLALVLVFFWGHLSVVGVRPLEGAGRTVGAEATHDGRCCEGVKADVVQHFAAARYVFAEAAVAFRPTPAVSPRAPPTYVPVSARGQGISPAHLKGERARQTTVSGAAMQ